MDIRLARVGFCIDWGKPVCKGGPAMAIRLNPDQSDPESDLETQLLAIGALVAGNLMSGALLLNSFSPEIEAVKCYFESASALSATGLSTGATTTLWDVWGKLLLIVFMFAGRVGPLTIILFFSVREKHYKLRYPEEQVIVG